jgi:hypothetical protein
MNQAPTEYKSKPTINQIPTVLSKGSLFIRWYLKSSLSPFLCPLFPTLRHKKLNFCSLSFNDDCKIENIRRLKIEEAD